jgi:hypothetical protein
MAEAYEEDIVWESTDLAIDQEKSPPIPLARENEDAVMNYEQALPTAPDEKDLEDLNDPEGGYRAYAEAEAQPLIKTATLTPEEAKGAYDGAKGLGLSFVQGVWNGAEQIGYSLAELGDMAFDMEDENYFLNYVKDIEIQPEEWNRVGNAAMTSSTANSLAGGAGQFLSGFVPALGALRLFKASGKVMPWMKKIIGTGVAGAITDYAVWDYTEKRATNYLVDFGDELLTEAAMEFKDNPEAAMPKIKEALGNVLTDEMIRDLQYEEGDSALKGRTKQAIEGFVLGKILDPIMGALGSLARLKGKEITAYGQTKKPNKAADLENQYLEKGAEVKIGRKAATVVEPVKDGKIKVKMRDGTEKLVDSDEVAEKMQNLTKKERADLLGQKDLEPSAKQQSAFNKAWKKNDLEGAGEQLMSTLRPLIDAVDSVPEMDVLLSRANELAENAVQSARGWKEAAKEAGARKQTATQTLGDAGGRTKKLDSSILAMNIIKKAMDERVLEAGQKRVAAINGKKGITRAEYKKIVGNAYAMNQYAKSVNGEVGRALNIMKMTKNDVVDTDRIFNEIDRKGWNSLDEHARMMSEIEPGKTNVLEHMGERNWMKAWTEGFINSVLSPTSLGINITSNTIMMIARTADIHMAAFRGGGGVTHKQAFAHTFGYLRGIREAFAVMIDSYRKDKAMFSNNKLWTNEFQPKAAITSGNLGFQGEGLTFMQKNMNTTIDTIGKIFRGVPGGVRSMMATDEFFKVLNHRAYSMKMAVESVEQSGGNIFKNPKGFAKGVEQRFQGIQNTSKAKAQKGGFGSKADDAYKKHNQAMEEAHLATFTNDWGPNSEKAYKTLRSQPWTSLILPFVRQPVNNMLYLAKSTPGLNLMSRKMSAELAAGGSRAQIAQAHLNVASMVWAYAFMTAFSEEGAITGNPKGGGMQASRTEAGDLGIDPNTIKDDNGDYVNYRGGEPVAGRWAIAAGLMHQWMKVINEAEANMTDEQIEQASWDFALQGSLTVLDNFKDQSSLRGLENTLKLVEGGTEKSFKKRAESMLVGWIPNLSGQIKYIREHYLGEDQVRIHASGFGEELNKRLGGGTSFGNKTVRIAGQRIELEEEITQLNAFGEPMPGANPQMLGEIVGPDVMYNPLNAIPTNIRKTKGFDQPWQKEIIRVREALPGESVLGRVPTVVKNIKIDHRERHNMLKFLKHMKLGGQTLAQRMAGLQKSDRYNDPTTTDRRKADLLYDVYQKYVKAAGVALFTDAAQYYKDPNKHIKRTEWKKLGLVHYGRSESIAKIGAVAETTKHNRNFIQGDYRRRNPQDIGNRTNDAYGDANQQMQNLFR